MDKHASADVFDDLDQLVEAVALAAGEVDELFRSLDDGAAFGCPCNRGAAPASELEQSLVAEQPQGPEDGVGVDVEDGSEILRGREPLSRFRLSVGDRPSDLTGDLFVQIGGVAAVDLDIQLTQRGAQPLWSPDGRKIAFRSGRHGNLEIYVMNADGSEQQRLTRTPARSVQFLAWSPAQKKQ
jgi:hypothetical protein